MRRSLEVQRQAEGPASAPPPGSPREPVGVELRQGDFVNIVATVNLTRGTGEITHRNRVARALVPAGPAGADSAVARAVDAGGRVLAGQAVPIKFDTDREADEDRTGLVDAFLPAAAGGAALEVVVSGRVVARREVGPNMPPRPPAAAAGASIQVSPTAAPGGETVLDWSAGTSPAPGVSYNVLVSSDGGATWQTVAVGLTEPRLQLDTSQFGVARLRVRVLASNGLQTEEIATRDIEAAGRADAVQTRRRGVPGGLLFFELNVDAVSACTLSMQP